MAVFLCFVPDGKTTLVSKLLALNVWDPSSSSSAITTGKKKRTEKGGLYIRQIQGRTFTLHRGCSVLKKKNYLAALSKKKLGRNDIECFKRFTVSQRRWSGEKKNDLTFEFIYLMIAVRQNSYGSTGYIGSHGPYRMDGGSGGQSEEDEMGSFTDYGSIVGSFPPSPAGSFRSALDAPGFSRCVWFKWSILLCPFSKRNAFKIVGLERERGRHLPPSNRSVRIVHALATRRRFTPASKRNSRDSCVMHI